MVTKKSGALPITVLFVLAALTPVRPAWAAPGDLNCDGVVDLTDVGPFALALTDPAGYEDQYGDLCNIENADMNADGRQDGADIRLFLAALISPMQTPTTAELAGDALDAYPFFEYVSAFNEDATVEIAVDPTRFPDIVGATCDVYIVAARTEDEWSADPVLIDVRPGGPQDVTFGGSTIQENTFLVAAPGELGADAGIHLGAGYDVVLDLNQDAMLDAGDMIDGLADEAGFYVLGDLVSPGPLPVTSIMYSGGSWLGQKTWYPTDIGSMGQLPLVVISHGNGHDYTWYDYLQQHLASYGLIVMSHQNNTGPGIETASSTTLTNTDYIIGNQATIGGGVLDGHLDSHRIVWIGHSRGGEGVGRAVDRLYDGDFTPAHYSIDDLVLVSSIAPNDYLGRFNSNPHGVNYHLLLGAADGDNGGWPDRESDAPFHVFERAEGNRLVTYIHGADHNDFNCCGWNDFEGPPGTEIGRAEAQRVAKADYLALIKHYAEGSIPARDFLWRQYESLRPIGVAAATVVDHEYTEGPGPGVFVIDDFQSRPSLDVSSSGGAVTYDLQSPWEGQLDDTDGTFTWSPGDPMNGMARGRPDDLSKGLVFDWSVGTHRFIEFEVIPDAQDFTAFDYVSFRACQGTRHPETVAELVDLTFTVSLRDGGGTTGSINFGAYGGGIEEPYQRTGSGSGAGWQNEFETIRLRLTDFLTNGTGLDLADIAAVRFDFGSGYGSARGRVAIDDVQLVKTTSPMPGRLRIQLPDGVPDVIPPGVPTEINIEIFAIGEDYVPGSGLLHYRFDDGPFQTAAWIPLGEESFLATLPAAACGDEPEFFFSAEGTISGLRYEPPGAPAEVYTADVGEIITLVAHNFETDPGWTVSGDATDGQWGRGVPVGGGDRGDPPTDFDGSGQCILTDNVDGNSDVDGGTTTLTSLIFDLNSLADPMVSYARWYSNDAGDNPESDTFVVQVSNNGGTNWVTLETVGPSGPEVHGGWFVRTFRIADFVTPTAQFRIRWHASDLGGGSVVEAGLDAFAIYDFTCD